MANACDICSKGRLTGNKVSHSNIKTKRVQRPNLQRVKALVDGSPQPHPRLHALPALGPASPRSRSFSAPAGA